MSWITALAAFTAFMALLASLVTVAVEAWQKLFALRTSGLKEMLRALHDNVIQDPAATGFTLRAQRDSQSAHFAKQMTLNPAYAGHGRWWWPRNWPIINTFFFQPNLERLSALQFVEQFGQTPIGREAAHTLGELERKSFLARILREFDRYGEVQSDYFHRRAKAISAVMALGLVLFGNVNAFEVYTAMARDPALAARTQAFVSGSDASALVDSAKAAAQSVAEAQNALAAAPDGAVDIQALRQSINSAKSQSDALKETAEKARAASAALQASGLPIGLGRFPFCMRDAVGGAPPDARCKRPSGPDQPQRAAVADANTLPTPEEVRDIGSRLWSPSGFMWFLGVIATAGLLGLGAPFWFNAARTLATIAGGGRAAAAAASAATAAQAEGSVSRPTAPTIHDYDAALVRTAGAPLIGSGSTIAGIRLLGAI